MRINQTIISGNLTADPEMRYTAGGKAVCTLRIAHNHTKDEVSFFDAVCWDKVAETCAAHLTKGSGVIIVGSAKQERWESEGNKRQTVKFTAFNVQFITGKQTAGEGGQPDSEYHADPDDIPF